MHRIYATSIAFLIALLATLGACRVEQDGVESQEESGLEEQLQAKVFPTRQAAQARAPTAIQPFGGPNGIDYHGGPVMAGTVKTYYIWYGNWANNTAPAILTGFMQGLGCSAYEYINDTYGDQFGHQVSGGVAFGGGVNDNYSHGTVLQGADVIAIVAAHAGVDLPFDPNGIYFVLTSADVNQPGFCTSFCGWHSHATINGSDIKYSWVGNPDRCPSACEEQTVASPNNNPGADGMANVIAHEAEEAITDPDLNAWFDANGAENADKCAWTFGTTWTKANGSIANITLGGRDYLIQRNWLNAGGGSCTMAWTGPDYCGGATCGPVSDACGHSLSCGTCLTGWYCTSGTCHRRCPTGTVDCYGDGTCVPPTSCF